MTVEHSDMIPDGWMHWLTSNSISAAWQGQGKRSQRSREAEMLRLDQGRNFGFTRMVAHRIRESK